MLTASQTMEMINAFNSFLPIKEGLGLFMGAVMVGYIIFRTKSLIGISK